MFQGEIDPNSINYGIHIYNEYFWINFNSLCNVLLTCFI